MSKEKSRQCPGGEHDDTPGQVKNSNVSAVVPMAKPKRIDSMGGSEARGKDNSKRGG